MRLEWRPIAIADLQANLDFVANENPRAALRMSRQIRIQVRQLTTSPGIGRPGRISGPRELVVQRYPCIVVYTVDEYSIQILRLLHGAQEWPKQPAQA